MAKKHSRIDRESRTIEVMIGLYCRNNHQAQTLCQECQDLLDYSLLCLQKCLYKEGKTTCLKCPVHCYKPEMREKVRAVMRYSGPRMIYRHPFLTIQHLIDGRRKEPTVTAKGKK